MSQTPHVSFVVRTYKGREKLLLRALNSIGSQDTDLPVEALVVGDGADTLQPDVNHPFVKIINLGAKRGRSVAGNVGLEAAAGTYVNFLDDDDWLHPNHVRTLTDILDSNDELDAAYAAAMQLPCKLDISEPKQSECGEASLFYHSLDNTLDLVFSNFFPIQAVMFRRKLLDGGARLRPELDALEDWLFWQELLIAKQIRGTLTPTSTFLVPMAESDIAKRREAHLAAIPIYDRLRYEARVPLVALVEALTGGRMSLKGMILDRARYIAKAAGSRVRRTGSAVLRRDQSQP